MFTGGETGLVTWAFDCNKQTDGNIMTGTKIFFIHFFIVVQKYRLKWYFNFGNVSSCVTAIPHMAGQVVAVRKIDGK
jgi:hypothetical protein